MSVQDLLNYQAIRGSGYDSSGFSSNQNGNLFEKLSYMIANPGAQAMMNPKLISSIANCAKGFNAAGTNSSPTRTANAGYFFPIYVEKQIALTRLWVFNGSAVSGNLDIALYNSAGTRVVSTGSTAQSGTSSVQKVTVSYTLDPGFYWIGVALDNATGTFRQIGSQPANSMGAFTATSSFPLPASLPTPTSSITSVVYCGASSDSNFPIAID